MAQSKKPKNILRLFSPAKWWGSSWRDSLVSGNGVIGCSVCGGASNDVIMLTHADLWWQGKASVLPDVSENITTVKKLIDEGKHEKANSIISDALIAKGYRPQLSYPLPLCDLKIFQRIDKPLKDYSRSLNLDNGEITVGFKDSSTRYQRSVFVSKKDDLVVYEINKWGNKPIDVDFSFDLHEKFNNRTINSIVNLPSSAFSHAEGKYLSFFARSDNGLDFGAVGYVNFFGGMLTTNGQTLSITGAEKVFLVIKPFINVKNSAIRIKEIKDELKGFKLTYDKLFKDHCTLLSKTLSKAYLSLDDDDVLTDTELHSLSELTPKLMQKMWAYGRHLFVSSTTPETTPICPYGIFCGDYKGVDSSPNADGSLQLMYEHALTGNLTDYFDSLLLHYENSLDDLKKNSIRLFDSRGIVVAPISTKGTGLVGQTDTKNVTFTAGGAWLGKLFYDSYLCQRDQKALRTRIMPFIKEVAQFYLEFFKLKEDSFYESNPSHSPDSHHQIGKNALIDFACARHIFKSLIEICEELNVHKSEISKWEEFLTKIPTYKTNQEGIIKEYFDPKLSDEGGCSTALFYPLFPNNEVTPLSGEVFRQFERTAQKRFSFGLHHSSMSLLRFANVFIRLNQIALAEEIIMASIKHTCMDNMIFCASDWTGMGIANNDIWATYSIESNLLLTNAIQDMFVRSHSDKIWILPACKVNKGQLGGFLTRCGVEIDELSWDLRKGNISISLKAKKPCTISLIFPVPIKKYKGIGQVNDNTITNIQLPDSKPHPIEIKI